jgi:hypothetical protein
MSRPKPINIDRELLTELLIPIHQQAEDWYTQAADNRRTRHFDIATNCERAGAERAAVANQTRALLGFPEMTYE